MANVNYDKYLKMLTRKHLQPQQNGGASLDRNKPFGGFPPLYMCARDNEIDIEGNKNREYNTHKTAVSIKDIMQKRREVIPFIAT